MDETTRQSIGLTENEWKPIDEAIIARRIIQAAQLLRKRTGLPLTDIIDIQPFDHKTVSGQQKMPQEHRGRHKFAEHIGNWGSFAEVEVIVESRTGGSVVIDVPGLLSDPRCGDWHAGLQFGVHYALEHVACPKRDLSVRVSHLHTNPVDSSTLSVAFSTCFAVWDALGQSPKSLPYFDHAAKSFIFPS